MMQKYDDQMSLGRVKVSIIRIMSLICSVDDVFL